MRLTCGKKWSVGVAVCTLALAACGWSEVEPMAKQNIDGVSFITGGVGLGERTQLKDLFDEYTCRIELANEQGEYLAKADIVIRDSEGNRVLKTGTAGPWLLVDLSPGKYSLDVNRDGREKSFDLVIEKGKRKRLLARF